MSIANIVLNEVPNSNDTMYLANNVRLTTIAHNNSQWWLYSHHAEMPAYQGREIMIQ